MSTSTAKSETVKALRVKLTRLVLSVELSDGRSISVPLEWYPRLLHGNTAERNHWRLIGGGHGIHWPDLDEDISVSNLLAGQSSAESQASLQRWLSRRTDATTFSTKPEKTKPPKKGR
ncbi:MAG: DUF2442 domain-containing protein [Pirellulales bacterium]